MPKTKSTLKSGTPRRALPRPIRLARSPPFPLPMPITFTTKLMDMPEDIILRLYDFLPSLADKVRLACVSSKFHGAFACWSRTQRHSLDVEQLEPMSLRELICFFRVTGPYIRILHVDCAAFQKESLLVEFISEFCPNLEEIFYTNVTDEFHYRTIMSKMTRLKKVSIDCMDAEDVLNFDLEKNQNLEHFELVNGCYTGKHLCGFPNLKTLVLRDCLLWNSGEFGIPLKTLKVLNLDDCCFEVMNQSLYQKIAECSLELEELSFSGCDTNFEVIAALPNLRKCTLKTWMTSNELNIGFLTVLSENKGSQLTHLHLSGQFQISNEHARCLGQLSSLKDLRWSNNDVLEDDHFKFFNDLSQLEAFGLTWCGRVMDLGMMRLIRKCLQLKVIDLSDCEEITDEFILNAIAYCAKGAGRKLVINAKGTRITNSVLEHADYLSPTNNVKLNILPDF
ncbi:uncharacterized protein [Drosophila bipectinata]|uniref:uncharacterized protein n=1 Tax=Drosophila bipectinata TaxID=42026 RepID=UPI001C8A489B|nr:uncharacterized protein LOC108125567 [Drosophila bipectinata]